MSFNTKTVLATLIAPVFVAGTAHAAETGFYFGGSVGQTTVNVDDFDFDKTETGYKAFVGFNFLPFLGIEGGYIDFGSPSDSIGPIDIEVDATGWEAFVVGTLPIGPVDLFVKAGGVEADLEATAKNTPVGTVSAEESDELFAYGAGAAINFGKFAIRVEAEGYDTDEIDDLYFISVGATYHL
jgi:outer membrane immunogenic protein